MKFTTGIFFFLLISICYVANAQKAFDQVKALLHNLKNSNINDQAQADVRERAERAWCNREINRAVKLLARRQHDVDSLEAHIKYLVKTRAEARKDRASRVARIKSNLILLEDFKKQRCANNLLFVGQLREHMQAIEILKLLRAEIIKYFNSKPKGQTGAFIEKLEEYSSLFDEEHKSIFTELKSELNSLKKKRSPTRPGKQQRKHALDRQDETQIKLRKNKEINALGDRLTADKERTEKEIGTGHVDNKRGELKRLATPKWAKISDFNRKARAKILGMIKGLIKHLRASRKILTQHEIKASEDFAIFHNSMEKENEYLQVKIAELTVEIQNLTRQIRVSRAQLIKRKDLRDQAAAALKALRSMCQEKFDYFARQTTRRIKENQIINVAIGILDRVLSKLSKRVRDRASNINLGGKAGGDLANRVVKSEASVEGGVKSRQKSRAAVVF